ncbi:MAG: bifunctional [glutamate--ammonia ligase]-adenylyl-L-tyrosine phosphorylase/[glutamate--ammonia-ligase] adenylyltransferase [Zetaproteobacteria bacterium]|nr:MAG: bifunctional [glutamate--ammonia ligase]-adenylyl-L-tyrosine phosphorylase/[glutamate--ammonia-ligase] adenylyltransferase [Zetaproteobacteria bacterium]
MEIDEEVAATRYWRELARRAGLDRSAMAGRQEESPLVAGMAPPAPAPADSVAEAQRHLRRHFAWAMCHIIWWELALHGEIARSWRAISDLADALLTAALTAAEALLAPRFGRPEQGRFALIALGKLGGRELNLASDIDLMMVWDGEGETRGGRRVCALADYYAQLARMVIRLIDEQTEDGAIWPVDMRLRPGGAAAPIVLSLTATLDHYHNYGQTWERAMLSKARFVAGDRALGEELCAGLVPFIYLRHLDYTLVHALAAMKRRIDRQAGVGAPGPGFDVKRGRGGIREIEFMVQSRQLLFGGRRPEIRARGTIEALAALDRAGLIAAGEAEGLACAYRFWRRVEHAVQARRGEQTQRLPDDYRRWLARALAIDDPHDTACRHASWVHALFVRHMEQMDDDAQGVDWLEQRPPPLPEGLDAEAGVRITRALDAIAGQLRRGLLPERSTDQVRRILQRAMPAWLDDANGVTALESFAELLRAIAGRATWIDLLATHEGTRDWLIGVLAASRYIAGAIVRNPSWLEWPLACEQGDGDIDRIRHALAAITPEQGEAALAELGRQVDRARLHCALAVDAHSADADRIGRWLSGVADEAARAALRLACARMGLPDDFPLVLLAMGKHGSREMGLGSDLDMVFVLVADGEERMGMLEQAQRLGRRVIGILTAAPPFGAGYAFDARLRPSGGSGVLVTTLAGFADYQRHHAAVWEHQALCRARALAPNGEAAARVMQVVEEVLALPRDRRRLADEVVAMRAKMVRHLASRDDRVVNLKQDPGGMVDIEFLAQYARLAFGTGGCSVAAMLEGDSARLPDPWRREAAMLTAAHRRYRTADLLLRVELSCAITTLAWDPARPEWETLRRHGVFDGPEELRRTMTAVRRAFELLLSEAGGSSGREEGTVGGSPAAAHEAMEGLVAPEHHAADR